MELRVMIRFDCVVPVAMLFFVHDGIETIVVELS